MGGPRYFRSRGTNGIHLPGASFRISEVVYLLHGIAALYFWRAFPPLPFIYWEHPLLQVAERGGSVYCAEFRCHVDYCTVPHDFPDFFDFRVITQYSIYSGEVSSRLFLYCIMVIYERLELSEFAHVFCITPHCFLWQFEIVRVA